MSFNTLIAINYSLFLPTLKLTTYYRPLLSDQLNPSQISSQSEAGSRQVFLR